MLYAIGGGLLLFSSLLAYWRYGQWKKRSINVPAFIAMLTKLIMANNIDRSIRLCNSAPSGFFPSQCKLLLCKANREYGLELVYQQTLLNWDKEWRSLGNLSGRLISYVFLSLFVIVAVVYSDKNLGSLDVLLTLLAMVVFVVSEAFIYFQFKNLIAARPALLEVRNLLFERANNYIPPEYKLRRSPENVAEQKERMQKFEEEMQAKKADGENVDRTEEFLRRVDLDGNLPE